MLHEAGIEKNICFKYDDIYFPYIVIWMGTTDHKFHYQLFYDYHAARDFYMTLAMRNKKVTFYKWSTSLIEYRLMANDN